MKKLFSFSFFALCSCLCLLAQESATMTWNQVQTLDSLKTGVQVFFASVKTDRDYVMGCYDYSTSKSNIHGVAATFSEDRHQVTAPVSCAYTLTRRGDTCVFIGADGKYLYHYDGKNLSSNASLNKQTQWTVKMAEDFTIDFKNVYHSSYTIYCNHNSNLFCCYNSFDASNLSHIVLYSSNAPAWQDPVYTPEMTILVDKDTLRDVLDFGRVEYDDTWGTESDPYQSAKTLTFVTKHQAQPIALSLYSGKEFTIYTDVVPAKGGTASVGFSTKNKGTYTDTLYIESADTLIKVFLTAQAVTPEEVLPKLTLSTTSIYLNPNTDNNMTASAEMSFSVENLKKNLYVKWEKGEVPTWGGTELTILAGNDADEVYFGSATNLGTSTRTDEPILLEVTTYQTGTFTSTLCFYTFKENSKEDLAFEERVTITIHIDPQYLPCSLSSVSSDSGITSSQRFTLLGQPASAMSRGIVIENGKKYLH